MWSRIVEVMVGCWLAISPFIFGISDDETMLWVNAFVGSALTVLLALSSLHRRFDKAHLGIFVVVAWLAGHTFLGAPETPPPPAYQNQLVVALLLGMVAVLPTRTQEPPRGWLEFYGRRGRDVDPYHVPGSED